MSYFDDVVGALTGGDPSANTSLRAFLLLRKMRDKRLCTHALGCCLLPKKVGCELLIYVDTPVWAQEFHLNGPAVLAEWNYLCSQGYPDMMAASVRFAVSTRVHLGSDDTFDAPSDTYDPVPLPALDAQEIGFIEAEVAVITDERLRERARAAMMSSLRWKKSNNE